jgi:hypothetical protein
MLVDLRMGEKERLLRCSAASVEVKKYRARRAVAEKKGRCAAAPGGPEREERVFFWERVK